MAIGVLGRQLVSTVSAAAVLGVVGGGPGAEELESFVGRRAGFGGVDGEGEAGFGGHLESFVGEGELADDGVVEPFGAGAVVADVVAAPAGAEVVAAGGELADEVVEQPVVRVAAGFGAQDGDADVRGRVPVGVEALTGGVEEREPGDVRRPARVGVHVAVEGAGESVGGEDVHAAVAHERRSGGDGVERPLQARSGRSTRAASASVAVGSVARRRRFGRGR